MSSWESKIRTIRGPPVSVSWNVKLIDRLFVTDRNFLFFNEGIQVYLALTVSIYKVYSFGFFSPVKTTKHCIYTYIRTVSSQNLLSALPNWFMGRFGRATCTVHLMFAGTSQQGIKYTKAKEQLRFYCPIYILCHQERKKKHQ